MTDRATHEACVAARDALRRLVDLVDDQNKDAKACSLAEDFCAMSDDGQARFFEEVARIMATWGAFRADSQRYNVAQHMKTCACTTESGRDWVRALADDLAYELPVPEGVTR